MFDFEYLCPVAPICESERSTDLECFRNFDFQSIAGPCDEIDELIEIIVAELSLDNQVKVTHPRRFAERLGRIKVEIRSVIWNFYLCSKCDYDLYLMLSFGNHAYSRNHYQNPFKLSREMTKIIYMMESFGWVRVHRGYFGIHGKASKVTRIRQTMKMIGYIKLLPKNIRPLNLHKDPIVLKDRETKKIILDPKFDKDESIKSISKIMDRFNQQISKHKISLLGCSSVLPFYVYATKEGKIRKSIIRTDRTQLTAIFHKKRENSFCYGRMHCGFWQEIPSEYRKCILIDDEKCVELDYSSQILNIVASMNAVQVPDNAYIFDIGVPGLSDAQTKLERVAAIPIQASQEG